MNNIYKNVDIYGGKDPREIPSYGNAEAARYIRLPDATLPSWIFGRTYFVNDRDVFFKPLIHLPGGRERKLSFSNLVEAHVLRSLRTKHGLSIKYVRSAIQYALGIKRLLLSKELLTEARDLLIEKYGELINLSKSGQLAPRNTLIMYLDRIERDHDDFPIRIFPFITRNSREIVIDPYISFGRPVLKSKSILTRTIVDRIDAGEKVAEIAADYDLDADEITAAIQYELAA